MWHIHINMGNAIPKLHVLKHDKDNVLMLPIVVADPRLNHRVPMYTEAVSANWLQINDDRVDIVELPGFDIDVMQIASTASNLSADTSASMALLVGSFMNDKEMNRWIHRAVVNRKEVLTNQKTFEDKNLTIKVITLSKHVYNSLTYEAFFINHKIEKIHGYYALFIDE